MLELGPAGRRPTALPTDPIPHHLVMGPELVLRLGIGFRDVAWGMDADRKLLGPHLSQCPVVQVHVGRKPPRVATDDGEREREPVTRRPNDRLRTPAYTYPHLERRSLDRRVDAQTVKRRSHGSFPADRLAAQVGFPDSG